MHQIARSGFTLTEVMAALAIIGFALTALAALQIALTRSTVKATKVFERIWTMAHFLNTVQTKDKKELKENKRLTKTLEQPALKLIYEIKEIPKNSSLGDLKNLKIEQVIAQWKGPTREVNDTIITFKYEQQDEDGHKST